MIIISNFQVRKLFWPSVGKELGRGCDGGTVTEEPDLSPQWTWVQKKIVQWKKNGQGCEMQFTGDIQMPKKHWKGIQLHSGSII